MQENDWQRRSDFWSVQGEIPKTRKRRERSTETLILCGHGIALRIENGSLAIKNGFTHFPQEQETFRYFRGDLDRPAKIIVLDGSGHLTFDALDWLAEQDVPLIRVSWTGEIITVAGGRATARIVRKPNGNVRRGRMQNVWSHSAATSSVEKSKIPL